MARLEHAKLMAKIQKKQEEKRVIKVTFLHLSTFKHLSMPCTIVQWRGRAQNLTTGYRSENQF